MADRFLGDFAEIRRLTQIYILLRVGCLCQTPNLGKIA
ncbi:MAG: hypothetical protein K940chlam7_00149 [Chlamydiae bacterium]|nr:hypothetical protein [Chlamydiota bacterium]